MTKYMAAEQVPHKIIPIGLPQPHEGTLKSIKLKSIKRLGTQLRGASPPGGGKPSNEVIFLKFWAAFSRACESGHSNKLYKCDVDPWTVPDVRAAWANVHAQEKERVCSAANKFQALARAFAAHPVGLGRRMRTKANILALRRALLKFVARSKQLTTEDFFLLFSYSVCKYQSTSVGTEFTVI